MGWRFRRSFTVVPGLRLNLSKSGLSASIGGAPLTLNVGPRGVMGTASLPGTGISYRHHFSNPSGNSGADFPPALPGRPNYPIPQIPPGYPETFIGTGPVTEVHSASTELLTSETLKELKQFVQTAHQQYQEISRDLDSARDSKIMWEQKLTRWDRGFLLKRIFKKKFASRREMFDTETARVAELEEQLRLSVISTQIDVEGEQAEMYYRMRDAFAGLCECAVIWDVKTYQATDKFHERTVADTRIGRDRVRFELGRCDLIAWDKDIPHLRNAKGGELYLYPGFILYRAALAAFSLIEYHEVIPGAKYVRFHEEDGVPADALVVGTTWAKANKDGSRDRRFANNCQIPIAQYGSLLLQSGSGLWEEFQFSNPERMFSWVKSLIAFTASFAAVSAAKSMTAVQ